ncbi:hypothetical protein [Lactiplantibacillus pentosus]|uniref:hypothetical protein n=1 Tax=Lactiplantibacillus pentosus TaxID=1589 RepID=UPI0021823881|nr:hypothetical protein [Lactiplantibacillus pentosus]MCT0163731.1 hypothetical protein [Lactiplantibacillus pentosus]MCT3296383.1 hypothetical protein [Lactiplantibacillus pentosus]
MKKFITDHIADVDTILTKSAHLFNYVCIYLACAIVSATISSIPYNALIRPMSKTAQSIFTLGIDLLFYIVFIIWALLVAGRIVIFTNPRGLSFCESVKMNAGHLISFLFFIFIFIFLCALKSDNFNHFMNLSIIAFFILTGVIHYGLHKISVWLHTPEDATGAISIPKLKLLATIIASVIGAIWTIISVFIK